MNIFRIPFLMERMTPAGMVEPIDPTYLDGLMQVSRATFLKPLIGSLLTLKPHRQSIT